MSIQNESIIVRRLWALIIDGVLACILSLVLTMFTDYMNPIRIILPMLLLLLRDAYKQSPGKTFMKLRVVDVASMQRAKLKYRILRQISLPFALIEIVVCLFTHGVRFTDFWCGTKVVSATDSLYLK